MAAKRMVAILVLGLLVLTAGGCSQRTTMIVGTEATFPPFEFVDDDNNVVGFDIDIINWIAEELGWEIEIQNQPFETLTESLATGKVDIVIAGMTITAERAKKVAFSDPYYDASQVVVVREDETEIQSVDDLADKVIAVQMGTTGADEAAEIKGAEEHPDLKQFRRVNEAFMELKNGRADAVIIDEPVARNYIAQLGGMKVVGEPFTDEQFGIAVALDDTELLEQINEALAKLFESGEYDRLIKKWFED